MSSTNTQPLSMQQVITRLHEFWAAHGCTIWQPYSEKVGAGTMNPATVLRVLGPEPWNVAYVEPSFRPDDGRFAENPNRMQMHHQYQVIIKPSPENSQELYLDSLLAIGINPLEHDLRFVEDDWESPTLGAWGLGWEVWCDGMEISQYTYFQQVGGLDCDPVSLELTYGLERLAMYVLDVDNVYDLPYNDAGYKYGDVFLKNEQQMSAFNFDYADTEILFQQFAFAEKSCQSLLDRKLALSAERHDHAGRYRFCSRALQVGQNQPPGAPGRLHLGRRDHGRPQHGRERGLAARAEGRPSRRCASGPGGHLERRGSNRRLRDVRRHRGSTRSASPPDHSGGCAASALRARPA